MITDLGEVRLKVMDETGIDMQVLSFSMPGVEVLDASDGTAMAKIINDRLSQAVKEYPERFAGFAAEASLPAMRLICSGVFDTYPGLKIILGHLGEAIPFWLWRIDSRYEEEKNNDAASAEAYKNLQKLPSQYFKENFYVTTSGMFWEPVLQFVNSVLGSDRILFATDYPYESSMEAAQFMESVQLDDEDKERIAYLNAEKLLRL